MRADIMQQHTRDQQQQQQHFQQCMWEMQNADQGNSKNLAAQLEAAQLQLKSLKAQHQATVSNLELQVNQLSGQVRRSLHHNNYPSLCLSV
jgi:G:T/U-mismatch repair DNA glycosylase